jgi:VWFA-related protein
VDLVQVDAVVTDAQGRHVANLKPEDFEILEDGRPQKITHFSYVEGAPGPARPGNWQDEANLGFVPRLRPQDVRRTIVLVADDLSYSPAEFPRVRLALRDFVDRQMEPGDLVSIMTTSGGMGALEQLTSDKRSLYAAIARIVYSPSRNQFGGWIVSNQVHYDFAKDDRALAAGRAPLFAAGSTSALGYAIQALRDMPGRKAVALFSAGFGGGTPALIEMANRSSVVIYTFDMRGIVATYDAHLPPGFWASQGPMDVLARGTGGIFFHETNSFGGALAAALEDMSSYYLIGYRPQREDFDRVKGNPQFHKIQVKALRAGLTVRSRDGFAGVPDAEAVSQTDPDREFGKALYSPFQGDALPVYLSAFYSASADNAKTGRLTTTLRALLVVDARGLRLEDAPGGKKKLVLDVLAGIWGESEKPVAIVDKKIAIEKAPDETEQSITLEVDVPVARAGAYQLRSAVREPGSGQTGTATAFVEIPDFNRHTLALSSVLLSDRDPGRTGALERAGVIGGGSPATRVFASGAALDYDCSVFGTRAEKNSGKPKIEIEVHLFRGPERIFTGHPIPVPVTASETPVRATGQIRLPAFLPPGDYALELIAHDRAAGPRQSAAQWVDFRLAESK